MTRQPAYLKIYYKLKDQITGKAYRFGQKLPSKRQLADTEHLSVITISHAYDLLAEEGYVEARERSGYYVSYDDSDPFLSGNGNYEEDGSARETSGISPDSREIFAVPAVEHFPFLTYAKTVRKVLSDEGEKLFVKSENQGRLDLREAIASYLRRSRGMEVSPAQILLGSGAEYLYGIVVAMLGRDKVYGVEDPSYEMIEKVYVQNGVSVEKLKMEPDGIRSSALQETGAEILHVTPFHSYPSGATADATKRAEYINWAKHRNAFIVEDDYDSEFTVKTRREDTLFSMEPDRHVLYINTFSRTISHATRVGYLVLPNELSGELLSKVAFYSCTVPVLDQVVLRELLNSGEFERHINRVRRNLRG
ncbi:MAG: PLP-dependent aminotransferase family protein [Lachnospiraceae bacterium]|uniref:PLP-dependent aminotransferase family protein n=1 Tax=Candidatus Weimeria bifida TaxID=2599074 RepID=A0A6N7IZB2_9FIRM|nr:PLP-dependent aminotransferase family protein [Candidatus Weimeria bifida]RRF96718.1 MAG: PLP-dependent aminotransferase family protein [Lachnospiraceae bacterium]